MIQPLSAVFRAFFAAIEIAILAGAARLVIPAFAALDAFQPDFTCRKIPCLLEFIALNVRTVIRAAMIIAEVFAFHDITSSIFRLCRS